MSLLKAHQNRLGPGSFCKLQSLSLCGLPPHPGLGEWGGGGVQEGQAALLVAESLGAVVSALSYVSRPLVATELVFRLPRALPPGLWAALLPATPAGKGSAGWFASFPFQFSPTPPPIPQLPTPRASALGLLSAPRFPRGRITGGGLPCPVDAFLQLLLPLSPSRFPLPSPVSLPGSRGFNTEM